MPGDMSDTKMVLVVDDEPDILFLVKAALTRTGYQVITAENGRKGLDKARETLPDLIIADVMMPDMDGNTLLRELRLLPSTSHIPVMMLTALNSEKDITKSLDLGADDYITKPFHIQEFLARVKAKFARPPVPVAQLPKDFQTRLLNEGAFNEEARRELERAQIGSGPGCMAYIELAELAQYTNQMGASAREKVLDRVIEIIRGEMRADDVLGWNGRNRFMLLLPGATPRASQQRLEGLNRKISINFQQTEGNLNFTPVTGYCNFEDAPDHATLLKYTRQGLAMAATHLDLLPYRHEPGEKPVEQPAKTPDLTTALVEQLQFPIQAILVVMIGWIFPFFLYMGLEAAGITIVFPVYLLLVLNYMFLAAIIWAEGLLSVRQNNLPPLSANAVYPPASAIISVYLPECAATIVETLHKYLAMDYPGKFQIVLAYHTGGRLPVEDMLEKMARSDSRLVLHRVNGPSTKTQNINSALASVVSGEFVGIFESQDEPDPDSFRRAWTWLAAGYDVVQGHNLIKNGDASFISRLSAIEGETYYAASLPGKVRMGKGIPFGGTNNYWRTGVLKLARLRSSGQTSVPDLVMRVTLEGRKMAYDPLLVARRLAPVSWTVWANGLVKRAQGWYQVMLKHSWKVLWDDKLTFRQKLVYTYSLLWREISRWLLLQVIPLLVIFLINGQISSFLALLAVALLSVGPIQSLLTFLTAHPDIRRHKRWFIDYCFSASFFLTDLKRFLACVGQIRELLKESFARPVIAPREEKEDIEEEAPAVPLPAPATILMVDDDPDIRVLIYLVLSKTGYNIIEATNGREALQILENNQIDLILTDILMPEMDGYELLEKVRANPKTAFVPVLMLSINNSEKEIVKAFNLGADDYILKPARLAELTARIKAKLDRPTLPGEILDQDPVTNLPSPAFFKRIIDQELNRALRTGSSGCLACLNFEEIEPLNEKYGNRVSKLLAKQVQALVLVGAQPLDRLGMDEKGNFLILLPDSDPLQVKENLAAISSRIVNHNFKLIDEQVRLTPVTGYSVFGNEKIALSELLSRAETAMDYGYNTHDLQPQLYTPKITPAVREANEAKKSVESGEKGWQRVQKQAELPVQIGLTYLFSFVIPLLLYFGFDGIGLNIAAYMYFVVVIALLVTATLIWVEGLLALRVKNPPPPTDIEYPSATAIIAAYLPNEAATIVETVEAFLKLEYPGKLKIILAYNTPRSLPVENVLAQLAAENPRFTALKVENSTSKAQNVNAALGLIDSEFVGVFDADHHPDQDSFMRAWVKLSSGYDVVQGHCLVRNGEASWVAKMVAVEFEAIYAISHPGRAAMHNFGIFGGSNGYWRTKLLRQTRMHGFMLTEDIDSSMRVTLEGYKIASDPYLVSRELATVNMKALWNQRMRWAQGWFQVSLKHTWAGLTSPHLNFRQKMGLLHLLAWREVYPWMAGQVIPIIIFWAWKYGGIERLDWFVPVFLLTTLFTLTVGPGQTILSYKKADPQIKQRKDWFIFYFFISTFFYTEYKNLIARVAQVKELMLERKWKVTPRSSGASKESTPPLA